MSPLAYGGDYNPDQWPREVWDEDVRLMRTAGVDTVSLAVLSWGNLELSDGRFEFGWLDDALELLHGNGISVLLGTATASPPAWLVHAHPDVLPVTADGVRLSAGSRQHYSPSSATYRRYADRLVRTLAERYRSHPALRAWHVNNELGCHVRRDYSEESARAFRLWLAARYGTIVELNRAWGTAFWSQRYNSFDEIEPPRAMPTFGNPTQLLDFDRFSSDAWLGVYRAERAILRELSPGVPAITNFIGFFPGADYWRWAREMDVIADDHYADPVDPAAPVRAAASRDLMRSLGAGRPWLLMEQAVGAVNWRDRNASLPPGEHRLLSLQAVARGADGIMQFQWRQSRAGAERFHSAMLPHAGTDTRIFRQTVELGAELGTLADVAGTRLAARVAILFDWDSWWAHEQDAMPTRIDYVETVLHWYRELWRRGVLVDFAAPGASLDGYDVVLAPATVVLSTGARRGLAEFVERGGRLLATYLTGTMDTDLAVVLDGYVGELREVLGIRVEEFTPPAEPWHSGAPTPTLELAGLVSGTAREWGEVVRPGGAEVRSIFVGGVLDGLPAVTRHRFGGGTAWYVATRPDELGPLVDELLPDGLRGTALPGGVERIQRADRLFVLNHGDTAQRVDGREVPGRGALVIRRGVAGGGPALPPSESLREE